MVPPTEGWAILLQLKLKTVPQGHVPWFSLIWTIPHLRLLSQATQGCFKLIINANWGRKEELFWITVSVDWNQSQ